MLAGKKAAEEGAAAEEVGNAAVARKVRFAESVDKTAAADSCGHPQSRRRPRTLPKVITPDERAARRFARKQRKAATVAEAKRAASELAAAQEVAKKAAKRKRKAAKVASKNWGYETSIAVEEADTAELVDAVPEKTSAGGARSIAADFAGNRVFWDRFQSSENHLQCTTNANVCARCVELYLWVSFC